MAKRCKAKYGVKYCQFGKCAGNNVVATWTSSGMGEREFSCDVHVSEITKKEDGGYMTEADYQTWGRF